MRIPSWVHCIRRRGWVAPWAGVSSLWRVPAHVTLPSTQTTSPSSFPNFSLPCLLGLRFLHSHSPVILMKFTNFNYHLAHPARLLNKLCVGLVIFHCHTSLPACNILVSHYIPLHPKALCDCHQVFQIYIYLKHEVRLTCVSLASHCQHFECVYL